MDSLSLSELKIDNPYLRPNTDVSELEKSIRAIGLIAPLVVDQDNKLLAGGRRYQALKNLGWSEAPILRVSGDDYQKELISIDENLVRKDLNKLELEANLRRAKELYTTILNQDSKQREEVEKELEVTPLEGEFEMEEEGGNDSVEVIASQKFVKDISEKTGMSPRQIYQAIKRDEKAADEVKDARGNGELSISQTNEIIRLDKKDQEKLLPLLKDKTVSEIKKLIKTTKALGVDAAIEDGLNEEPSAREFKQLILVAKKMTKLASRLEIENVSLQGDLAKKVQTEWLLLQETMDKLLGINNSMAIEDLHSNSQEIENSFQ